MFRLFIVALIIISPFSRCFSQSQSVNNQIGYHFDFDGNFIDGYLEVSYHPKTNFSKATIPASVEYSRGYYIDLDNQKVDGFFKYNSKSKVLTFKSSIESKKIVFKPEMCNAFVIGLDSFIVIQNFKCQSYEGESKLIKQRTFVSVEEELDGMKLYEYTPIGRMNWNVGTELIKLDTSDQYITVPDDNSKKSRGLFLNLFGEFEPIAEGLEKTEIDYGRQGLKIEKKYNCKNVPIMFKLVKYQRAYDEGEKVYFNAFWDEQSKATSGEYYAKIDSIIGEKFFVTYYFNSGVPYYSGTFASIDDEELSADDKNVNKGSYLYFASLGNMYNNYPPYNPGKFLLFKPRHSYQSLADEQTMYYSSGVVRKRIEFEKKSPKFIETYYANGAPMAAYSIKSKSNNKAEYVHYYNEQGQDLLDEKGNGKVILQDSVYNREIQLVIQDGGIKSAFYNDDSLGEVYLKYNSFSSSANSFMNYSSKKAAFDKLELPDSAFLKGAHGKILMRFLLDKDGICIKTDIVKGISKECDEMVLTFSEKWLGKKMDSPLRVEGERVCHEFVLSFDLELHHLFYRPNTQTYWYQNMSPYYMNQPYMNNQMLQMQNLQMQQIQRSVTPPTFRTY
jgi:hypothetical protein